MRTIRNLLARFRTPRSAPSAPKELAIAAGSLRFVDRTAEDRLLDRDSVHAYADSFSRRY